jgi:hypothetical protein
VVLRTGTLFSSGYMKPFSSFRFGTSEKACGLPVLGVSLGYADAATGLGFA